MAMTQEFAEQAQPYDRSRLWLPPGRRDPATRQAIGSPYVWDGQTSGSGNGRPHYVPGRHSRPEVDTRRPATTAPAIAEPAVIGDELREIVAWCELSPCIARYTDRQALGQADIVTRAVASGWCKDAIGRLICPACQQHRPIWSAAPLVPRRRSRRQLVAGGDDAVPQVAEGVVEQARDMHLRDA